MTSEMQKEVVKILFNKNSKLFFNELKSVDESNNVENPFIIKIEEYPQDPKTYELKDEYKESLSKLSLAETLQILKVNDNDDVKTIKKWVTFFGIILIIQIAAGIIVGLNMLLH